MRLTRRRLVEEASAKRLRPSKTVLTDQPMQENKMARPCSMHDANTGLRGEAVRCGAVRCEMQRGREGGFSGRGATVVRCLNKCSASRWSTLQRNGRSSRSRR